MVSWNASIRIVSISMWMYFYSLLHRFFFFFRICILFRLVNRRRFFFFQSRTHKTIFSVVLLSCVRARLPVSVDADRPTNVSFNWIGNIFSACNVYVWIGHLKNYRFGGKLRTSSYVCVCVCVCRCVKNRRIVLFPIPKLNRSLLTNGRTIASWCGRAPIGGLNEPKSFLGFFFFFFFLCYSGSNMWGAM